MTPTPEELDALEARLRAYRDTTIKDVIDAADAIKALRAEVEQLKFSESIIVREGDKHIKELRLSLEAARGERDEARALQREYRSAKLLAENDAELCRAIMKAAHAKLAAAREALQSISDYGHDVDNTYGLSFEHKLADKALAALVEGGAK